MKLPFILSITTFVIAPSLIFYYFLFTHPIYTLMFVFLILAIVLFRIGVKGAFAISASFDEKQLTEAEKRGDFSRSL